MVNETSETLLRWIPLLPLLAAVFHGIAIGVVRRSTPRTIVIALSCGSVALSFVISCIAFIKLIDIPPDASRVLVDPLYTWFGAGIGTTRFTADLALRVDPLSAVMALVVTGVGSLIHVYSVGYMDDDHRDDRGFQRFFCYMNLFTFSMLVLVLADNLVLMFLGWEGVGLCSYLLMGFWYSDRHNAYCGSKAFIVNRVGDFGFLIGIFLLFASFVSAGVPAGVGFADIAQNFAAIADRTIATPWGTTWRLVDVIGLCLFVGAVGKSAQIPLYVWLPDAMAGPTPVSALIHAATMVTAGVYMVCRLSFLYSAAPLASEVIAWIGALTALFAATIAIAQTDIKKVLAYSTVSQLGYMFLAAGCGGYTGAIFHLVTHAFFKALLFLGAGSVILAMHHEQDILKMGGLRRRIPLTRVVFFCGAYAISGFPFASGFFSKDEILATAFAAHVPGHEALYAIGLLTAGITAFYMWRLYFLVFSGETRAAKDVYEHAHEPSPWVTHPLVPLAFLSLVGGLLGIPQIYGSVFGIEHVHTLSNWLGAVWPPAPAHEVARETELLMTGAAVAIALTGFAVALQLYYARPELPARIAARLSGLYALVANKYYVDELYDAVIVRPLVRLSDAVLYRGVDAALIDGTANGLASAVQLFASGGLRRLQSGLAQGYVASMLAGTAAILWYLLR
ncbi:MAG: NADH-quinone oxidoreductase subunit L [Deltaproteobacteria bacterium]|nr:MAG: NADH-quinone oxidoreductase subunit L [Deltaproteobacteria bacterium]